MLIFRRKIQNRPKTAPHNSDKFNKRRRHQIQIKSFALPEGKSDGRAALIFNCGKSETSESVPQTTRWFFGEVGAAHATSFDGHFTHVSVRDVASDSFMVLKSQLASLPLLLL
jgi:hypothetical protein